jgi:peptidoglycan/xylan/chitin deacetylase (PgdA/CDA1 family)
MDDLIANPPPWPGGARCAVAITFDVDSDSFVHVGLPDRAHRLVCTTSWARYDEVAIPRMVDIFRRFDLHQTFFFPAWCMERYPHLVEATLAGGHEVGLHGYLHELANTLPGEKERELLERGLEITKRVTGHKPAGWRAPLYSFSENTTDLIAEAGFLYDSSLMGDDIPYILASAAGKVVELPLQDASDDWPQYAENWDFGYHAPIRPPERGIETFKAEFDAAWEHRGMWISVWHPFVSGRLSRAIQIVKLIEYMHGRGGVWFATLQEIAAHVNACAEDGTYVPRQVDMPYFRAPVPELAGVLGAPKS